MKIAMLGDLHLRETNPRGRKDNYSETLFNKFEFILRTCKRAGITALIQPGDFFESSIGQNTAVIDLIIRAYTLLVKYQDVKIYVVYGQHDLRFHARDTRSVPLYLLEKLGLVTRLIPDNPLILSDDGNKEVALYGSSWKEPIPKDLNPGRVNIWATHRMVIDNKKLWPGMKEFTLAKHLLKSNQFHLIVTGDNHRMFKTKYGRRWLINCGSLGRTNIDQAAHIPNFVIYDTGTLQSKAVRVPIASPKDVLLISVAKEKKEKKEELLAFVEKLKTASLGQRINYKETVLDVLGKINSDPLTHVMKTIFITAESKNRDVQEMLSELDTVPDK